MSKSLFNNVANKLNWRCVSPYLGVFIVLIFVTFYENLTGIMHPDVDLNSPSLSVPTSAKDIAKEMGTRIEWAIISVLWWLVGLFSVATSVMIIIHQSKGMSKFNRSILMVVPVALSILVLLLMMIIRQPGDAQMMASEITLLALDYDIIKGEPVGPIDVENSINGTAILAAFTIFLGCGAFSSLLVTNPIISTNYIFTLQDRLQKVRTVIITNSITFIVGAATIAALYKWAASLGQTPDDEAILNQIIVSASALTGFVFSAIVAGMYIPTILFLRKEISQLVEVEAKANPGWSLQDKQNWLLENGLKFDYKNELANILTLAAPFLSSGPLNPLFSIIGIG